MTNLRLPPVGRTGLGRAAERKQAEARYLERLRAGASTLEIYGLP